MSPSIKKQLLGPTTCAGASRTTQSIRRVMVYLVKMNLVSMADGQNSSVTGDAIHLVYKVNRYAHLDSFTTDLDSDPPVRLASFDLAKPGAVDAYWSRLRDLVKAWCDKSGEQPGGAKDYEGSGSSREDDKRPRRIVPTPKNASLPELFRRKNWKSYPWLAPHQRASLNKFFNDICLNQAHKNENRQDDSPIAQDTRIVTPKSPEVTALSRRIMVPPERVIKYCRQLTEVAGPHPSGAKVDFSSLYAVRFKCHVCGHLCFLKNSVADHYLKFHGQLLPEDESLYCEPDFYAQRLEQAKPPKVPGVKRLRKAIPSKASRLGLELGDLEVKEEQRDEMDDATWLQLLTTAECLVPLQQRAQGLPVSYLFSWF